jgi:hypothetical protein
MHAQQISVFLENKAGRLAEVTNVLSQSGVNIRALSLADTSDFGILRLIVNNNDAAVDALKNAGFTVRKTQVAAVEVPDRPGGLHELLEYLNGRGINVEYMYAFVTPTKNNALMIFRFDDTDAAVSALLEKGFAVIDGETLYTM